MSPSSPNVTSYITMIHLSKGRNEIGFTLLLTELQLCLSPVLSTNVLFLFQDPTHGTTLHLVSMSSQSSGL